jgi:class 3 adenylate cyclase
VEVPVDIADWLRSLELAQYEQAFRENDIDGDVLPSLTAEELSTIGVTSIGHRRKLLDAIAGLGAGMASTAPSAATATEPVEDMTRVDRRLLTVMFADLVGSTALSARRDPEDIREIIGAYHRCCSEVIVGHGGYISRYMGDGILAYFGFPEAHEDDAERAVRSALLLVNAVSRLETDQGGPLQVRIGIATGIVVVGDLIGKGEAREHGVVGDAPNLAARLQRVAEPGQVVILQATRRLAGGFFEYRDLGRLALAGYPERVQAWHVLKPSLVDSRFEARREINLALQGESPRRHPHRIESNATHGGAANSPLPICRPGARTEDFGRLPR